MLEMREKSPQEVVFTLEGEEFTLKELKLGRVKKLLYIQTELGELSKKYLVLNETPTDIKSTEEALIGAYKNFIDNVPTQIIAKVLNIVLIPKNGDFVITEKYVDENFSIPDLYDIVTRLIKINKLELIYQGKSFLSGNPNPIAMNRP